MNDPQTGKVMHAELKLGDSMLFLSEENLAYGARSPQTLGGSPVTIHHYVEDVDATHGAGRRGRRDGGHARGGHVLGRPLRQAHRPLRP